MPEKAGKADWYSVSLPMALAAMQEEIRDPKKNRVVKTHQYDFRYADLGAVMEAIRPAMTKYGFAVTHFTTVAEGVIVLHTVLQHASGEKIDSVYPVIRTGAKQQEVGAAMTYARRYAVSSLLAIAAEDDNDADMAGATGEVVAVSTVKSSAALKRDGTWEKFMAALNDCRSGNDIARLRGEYRELAVREGWNKAFTTAMAEEFEKAEAAFSGTGDTDE